MTTTIVEGFSVSHAAILDGTTGAEHADGDIYGVREASITPDVGEFNNTGDDAVLSSWFWFNYADVNVTSGYMPFRLIALMTGESIISATEGSNASPNDVFEIPMWTEDSLNVQPRPMLIRIPSKDSAGAVRLLDFVLYKVQFRPIVFQGPTYKDGLMVNYSGRALISTTNETGALLAKRAIGRIIGRPRPA